MIFFLLLVTATFRPPSPTVGDLITIELHVAPASAGDADRQGSLVLDPSTSYEVVSKSPTSVTIRSFEPKPFALSGQFGGGRFRNLVVPMKSVLKPLDGMEPAPLRPPLPIEPSRTPLIAIGTAAGAAVLLWTAVVLLARLLRPRAALPAVPPLERFRAAVENLRASHGKGLWAGLADAVREYLAAMDSELGEELTTSELVRRISGGQAPSPVLHTISEVLRLGDLEKFSPWGAPDGDFDALSERALTIPDAFEPPPVMEERAA